MSKIIAFILLCLSTTMLQAQTDSTQRVYGSGQGSGDNSNPTGQDLQLAQLRKDIIPHSPEAEAMAKYDVLPVTLYSGMPNISVPIGDIKTPRLSVSFSLSYNFNGYKPNESASWAGLGWSVQGGGVITRMVKGQVDEYMTPAHHYDDYASMIALTNSQQFLEAAANGDYDTEPDLYIFNVGGYSGKFVLIKGKAYLLPHQNIQVLVYGDGFKLIDDKGNTYLFNDYETTYQKQNAGNLNIPYHKSAWYLTSITSADKKDVISFAYQSYSFKQPATYVDSYTINSNCSGINTSCHSYQAMVYDGDHIDSKFLTGVYSNYGSILFGASDADRLDLGGSTGAKVLNDITVTGPLGSPFYKKLVLDHSYFGTNTKLRLDKITVKTTVTGGQTETTTTETALNDYRFEYEDGSFPLNSTRGIDLYGYYNGANNGMLFPSGYFSPSLQSYADRSSHIGYEKLAMLKKMTYPTGGYSTFDWEQNQKGHYNVTSSYTVADQQASNIYSNNTPVNGVTVVYKNFTLVTEQDVAISYQYFDGGTAPTIPILKLYNTANQLFYTSPALATGVYNGSGTVHLPAGDYVLEVKCQQATNQTIGLVSYKEYVIDNTLADGPGLRIRKISFFDNLHASTDAAIIKEYRYNEGEEILSSGFGSNDVSIIANCTPSDCAHNITQTTMQMSLKSALSDLAGEQFYYKNATEINRDVEHGGKTEYEYNKQSELLANVRPVKETMYKYLNGNFLPVKRTSYTYQNVVRNSFTGFKAVKTASMGTISGCTWCIYIPTPDVTQPVFGVTNVYGSTGEYDLIGDYWLTSHTVEETFNDAGTAALSNTTDYYYDNPNHQMPTRIVTKNSLGEEITAQMKYALDYTFGNCGSAATLNNTYVTAKGSAITAYGNCVNSLTNALAPYQPYNNSHQQAFNNVVSQYDCQGDLKTATTTLTNARNAAEVSYQGCLDAGINGSGIAWQRSVQWMQRYNVVSTVIEKYISVKKADNNEYLLAATRTDYNLFDAGSGNKSAMPVTLQQVEADGTLLKSAFLTAPDNYYKPQLSFQYDAALNLSGQSKTNDIMQTYLWGYQNAYPIAEVLNADQGSVAYTSFESEEAGNWTGINAANISSTITNPPTGAHYLQSSFDLTKTGLAAGSYIVSYWSNGSSYAVNSTSAVAGRQQGSWTYYEHTVTVGANGTIEVSGTGAIDELRLFPKGALMTTYTYMPSMGITSSCDPSNRISYYEYDNMGRLKLTRDQDRHILKSFAYQYAGY